MTLVCLYTSIGADLGKCDCKKVLFCGEKIKMSAQKKCDNVEEIKIAQNSSDILGKFNF